MIADVLSWVTIALNTLTLLNASYNCVMYLWKRKITRLLVLFFYILVVVDTVAISLIRLKKIFDPANFITSPIFLYGNISRTIGLASTYWLDGMTMLWLTISLRIMLRKSTEK